MSGAKRMLPLADLFTITSTTGSIGGRSQARMARRYPMNRKRGHQLHWAVGGLAVVVAAACLAPDRGLRSQEDRPKQPPTAQPVAVTPPDDGKLRIIAFGAHPD